MPFRCAFTIRSDTAYLAPLRAWVDAAFALSGHGRMRGRAMLAVSMALVEAVDNAIVHAHRRRRHLPIGIAIAINTRSVRLTVVDTGRGIGDLPDREPRVTASRGRGIFLIRRVMSRVSSCCCDGRHELRMVLDL